MFSNLGFVFKTYLTVINNWMQKDKKLKEEVILFKAIEEEEICIKTEPKAFANLIRMNSNSVEVRHTDSVGVIYSYSFFSNYSVIIIFYFCLILVIEDFISTIERLIYNVFLFS